MRECGLKSSVSVYVSPHPVVTPLAGVWIEIFQLCILSFTHTVTPLAGWWIEIIVILYGIGVFLVTPLAGVWIKI